MTCLMSIVSAFLLNLFCMERKMTDTPDNSSISTTPNNMFNTAPLPTGTPQGQQQSLPTQPSPQTQESAVQGSQAAHNPTNNVGETTHFGFKTVPTGEKQAKVAEVFHSVAAKYDLMNDLMSMGIHRLWKRFAITLSGVRRGQHVLDIAGGTGDLAKVFSREVGATGRVVLSDINESVLNVGRDRLLDAGCSNVDFVLANAETLAPFADESFDLLTISFGLRNVTDKDAALRSMYRVLKPGGRLLVLEFSKPVFEPLSKIYDLYSFSALPFLGKLITNDAESYRYLAESIRMHPDQRTLKQMMETAGFQSCDYHNLTGGIVALHRGFK
jgi:demethylmenaquinone methyltransferase/2-methoxy-6-polyprenyl-1,4-benzoquinol methylase